MSTLKLIFKLDNEKTTTISLADPREGLTAAEVAEVAEDIISRKLIKVGEAFPATVKSMYIQNSVKQDLI